MFRSQQRLYTSSSPRKKSIANERHMQYLCCFLLLFFSSSLFSPFIRTNGFCTEQSVRRGRNILCTLLQQMRTSWHLPFSSNSLSLEYPRLDKCSHCARAKNVLDSSENCLFLFCYVVGATINTNMYRRNLPRHAKAFDTYGTGATTFEQK